MATVYLAEDPKHHRRVAVKVLRPELAATLGPERFTREIDTVARFQHPHILPLLDSGESGGFLYYVMPYVEGESLRDRLAHHGELPIHDVVKILTEIADALAYADAHGVVHRDIKADNVLLSGGHALVMDLGVGQALAAARGATGITTAGVALGTPRAGHGLRRGQSAHRGERSEPHHHGGCRARNARVHGSRAGGRGSAHRSSRGHLRYRRARVRADRGETAVHR